MENKLYNIILIILIMTQTISCQEKATKTNENHFRIKGKEIFYDDHKIALGMPIDDFIEIVNSESRIAKYLLLGRTAKVWYWKNGAEAYTSDGKITYMNANGDYFDYKNIEEIIKKYGKYDNLKVEKVQDQNSMSRSIFYNI